MDREELERAVLDWARRRPGDGPRAIARGLGVPSRYGVIYDILRQYGLETAAKRAVAAAGGGVDGLPGDDGGAVGGGQDGAAVVADGGDPDPAPGDDAPRVPTAKEPGETGAGRDRALSPFDELGLMRRWRLQTDEMLPRTAPPPPPPQDPLAGERPEPDRQPETASDEPPPRRKPDRATRPVLRLPSIRLPRPAIHIPKIALGQRDGADDAGLSAAARAEGGAQARDGRLPDAVHHDLLAFVGVLPRCGTTAALCAWALAQAEEGARIALVDCAEHPALPAMLWGRVAKTGWEAALAGALSGMSIRDPELPLDVWPRGWDPTRGPDDPEQLVPALDALLAAARRAGPVAVAFDLGSFPPLPGGRPDPRLVWAADVGAAIVLVVPGDIFGVDAGARFVAALDSLGRPVRVRLLLAGPDAGGGLTPPELAAVIGEGAGNVRITSATRVPWDPSLAGAAGRGRIALRLTKLSGARGTMVTAPPGAAS